MQVITEEGQRPIKIWTEDIEPAAMAQLKNIAKLPFIHRHGVVAMPDVHYGKGATIGSVLATTGAIIPSAVGVDIGCGMCAVMTSLKASDLPENLSMMRNQIEREVLQDHEKDDRRANTDRSYTQLMYKLIDILQKHPKIHRGNDPHDGVKKACRQMSTLGGGNHFVEICLDENQNVWIMLHSGSRGMGNQIGNYFINLAKEDMQKYFITLPDEDLAYLPENTTYHNDYIEAVNWGQEYASHNRMCMMMDVIKILKKHTKEFECLDEIINCHHNYVERENHFGSNVWLTRKGAIRARENDMGIIPGSMGQRSYIVRGKGNPDSYCSCSHGAGRAMGRNQASKTFTVEDLIKQTQGVECKKDKTVLDEIPSAYKDIDKVMAYQTDLIEVVATLKQVLCVKG